MDTIFTKEYILQNYSEYFKYMHMKIEDTKLEDILSKAWANKKDLRKFFPFDKEGRILITTYEDHIESALKSFEKTINVLSRYLYAAIGGEIQLKYLPRMVVTNMMEDGRSKGRKVSKILSNYSRQSELEKQDVINRDLCTELPRLPLHGKGDIKLIVQNFYSELANLKKSKCFLYFSVNPIDILNASVDNVLSCNKLGGMAESAPMSVATSTRMAIARVVSDSGKLLGRCYVGISYDMMGFVMQPCYGMMGSSHKKDLCNWLRMYIDGKVPPTHGDKDVWKIAHNLTSKVPTEIFAESATANFYTDPTDTVLYRGNLHEINCGLCVGTSYCTICGKPDKNLFCATCAKERLSVCDNCGDRMLKAEGRTLRIPAIGSVTLCDECQKNILECATCGKVFIREKGSTRTLCSSCLDESASCLLCGRKIYISEIASSTGKVVTLVEDSVYAHRDCLINKGKEKHCSSCKRTISAYLQGNLCVACAAKELKERLLASAINNLKNFAAGISRVAHVLEDEPKVDDSHNVNAA